MNCLSGKDMSNAVSLIQQNFFGPTSEKFLITDRKMFRKFGFSPRIFSSPQCDLVLQYQRHSKVSHTTFFWQSDFYIIFEISFHKNRIEIRLEQLVISLIHVISVQHRGFISNVMARYFPWEFVSAGSDSICNINFFCFRFVIV